MLGFVPAPLVLGPHRKGRAATAPEVDLPPEKGFELLTLGLSCTTLDRTLEFGIGEWLAISFEAMGMVGSPVPIKLDNANDRIAEYLD